MTKTLTAGINTFRAVLLSLIFLFLLKNATAQVSGNASAQSPLATVGLTVTGIASQLGISPIAKLDWITDSPNLPGDFYIERLEPSGWKSLKKIRFINGQSNYTENDTISSPFCKDNPSPDYNISYQIRFIADNTTVSISNTASEGPFLDITDPKDVRNNIVNIITYTDPFGVIVSRPEIKWTPSRSSDIASYRIDRASPPGAQYYPVKTVSADSNRFIDIDITDVCYKTYAYAVVALDKCGNPSPGTYGDPGKEMQTILLKMDAIDPCERKANLKWNKYQMMPGGLGGYYVYRDDNYTGPVRIDEITDTAATTYSDSHSFQNGHTYSYKIEAYSMDKKFISSSCTLGYPYQGANLPDTVYITQATVENDQYIKVDYYYEPKNTISKLVLQRSYSQSGTWTSLDTLIASTGNYLPQYGSFDDLTALVHGENYFYRLAVIDDCNSLPVTSVNTANPILLQQEFTVSENKIYWNSYSTWLKGVETYEIYRIENGVPGTAPIKVVSAATNSYVEPASVVAPGVEVCYWVVAKENAGNTIFPGAASKSNICCILKEPSFIMPTAFNPLSNTNNRLRPVTAYVDNQGFKMTIFDRWGKQLYQTTDITNGWDGKINGQYVQSGLYSYLVVYKSIEGKEYLKRGTATLIR